jgi:hypothetical protein
MIGVGMVGALVTLSVGSVRAARGAPTRGPHGSSPSPVQPPVTQEHRYRIVGKLRMALLWAGRDVGSARLTWRSAPDASAVSLLAGSDPARAPRRMNQWTYLREEVRAGGAEVFSARSLDSADSAAGPLTLGRGPRFGVTCTAISTEAISIARTELDAGGVTYQMFPQFLDRLLRTSPWVPRRRAQTPDAHPGFLTALRHVLESDAAPSGATPTPQSVAYLYNDAVFDLRLNRRRRLENVVIGTRSFAVLTRADFVVRNRATADETTFGITYEPIPGRPRLPVQIFFQPSFWLAVELRQDDTVPAPPEPASDERTLAAIRSVCDAAHAGAPPR